MSNTVSPTVSPTATDAAAGGTPAASAAAAALHRYRWIILLGLITAAIMETLDSTIVNVALPQMAGNLGATATEIAWVSTSYILANVVVLPITALLTARFGRQRYLTFSIALFVTASFFCGTASSLGELVVWRLLQGGGGAALLSTAQATIRQIFPRREQALVQSLFLLGIVVAPTLGPTLGGWITDNYTWSWCFFINVPIGVTSALLVTTFLNDPPRRAHGPVPIDWPGIGLLAAGLGSLQYVLEEGNQNDWFEDPWILRLAVVAAVALTALVWWQLSPRNQHPVMQLRVLRNRNLAASVFLFIVLGFGLFGGSFLFPLFTQTVLGFTPVETGLALLPGGIATGVFAVACGVLLGGTRPKVDARLLVLTGMCLMLWAMWDLGHLTTAAGEADARYPLVIRGAALGLLFAPINNVAFGSIDPADAQQAAGLVNLARQLGGSFGIAALGTYLTRQTQAHRADLVTNVFAGSGLADARLRGTGALFESRGASSAEALQRAYALLDRALSRQASMLAYNDAWLLVLLSFAVVLPAVFVIQRPRGGAPADVH